MIGVFDSGLGGLTIFKEIERELPRYDYVYLGDNARAPYGDHNQETILAYATQGIEYLLHRGCVLVILACNTASAEALRTIQQKWLPVHYPDRNVLGVVRPLAEEAARVSLTKRIGVLGTRSTIASHAYLRELHKIDPHTTVVEQACRLLAPMIEEGYDGRTELRMILKKYVRPVKSANIDTLILGCTHYGIIERDVQRYFGPNVGILNSGRAVAKKLTDYLTRHPEYESRLTKNSLREFFTSEEVEMVGVLAKKFLGRKIDVRKATIAP